MTLLNVLILSATRTNALMLQPGEKPGKRPSAAGFIRPLNRNYPHKTTPFD